MKNKTWLAVSVGALMISIVGLGIQHISANPDDAQLTSTEIKELVKNKYPGDITELELERKNGQLVYEVEIEGPQGEYEMKLDASTGEVLKLEEKPRKASKGSNGSQQANDRKDDRATQNNGDEPNQTNDGQSSAERTRMSIDEAKETALNEIPGTIDEIELERDDGRLIYEVEIETDNREAEVEVDAYTGEIIMISWDD